MSPVLARIAAIESQFAARWPVPAAPPASGGFDQVLQTVATTAAPSSTPAAPTSEVAPYASAFFASGQRHGVPPQLLAAVGYVESRYQPGVVSADGKVGLMQLTPAASAALGIDPRDPDASIDAAARLLAGHEARFGSWDLALAAYFAGADAVEAAGRVAPDAATTGYVEHVMDRMGMT